MVQNIVSDKKMHPKLWPKLRLLHLLKSEELEQMEAMLKVKSSKIWGRLEAQFEMAEI